MPTPQTTARKLQRLTALRPTLGIVLGSGFHHVLERLAVELTVPYTRLPGFPRPTVPGHAGKLVIGRLGQLPVLVLSGRAHYYEGHDLETVTFGIRTLAAFGIRDLLLTNAAGGINRQFRAGDLMVITDHINFLPNPLRGDGAFGESALPGLPRFVDLTNAYDPGLQRLLRRAFRGGQMGTQRTASLPGRSRLRAGVYLAVSGPSYETPAEIRAFERLGADAVGMSTVPETIVARQCGLRVAGLSCITNLAAGRRGGRGEGRGEVSHAEVLATAEKVKTTAATLVARFAQLYAQSTLPS